METKDQTAFPIDGQHLENGIYRDYTGLTKREYFAGLALQGMLANPSPDIIIFSE